LGIRPEGLYAARGRPSDARLAEVPFVVEGLEPLGNEIFVHAGAGGQAVTARGVPQPLPAPGEELRLAFDLDRLHFFDADSGRTLAPDPPEAAAGAAEEAGTEQMGRE